MANGRSDAGFSDASHEVCVVRTELPGVGEALKREIAGMVLLGQPGLWGFEDGDCFGFGWE